MVSLNKNIHFTIWTEKEIETMPTTHIGTWAMENNVDIAKGYVREDRETGIDALGTGLPGIKREDLMVLPDADWQKMKDQLTYEAWAAKAMAAEQEAASRISK